MTLPDDLSLRAADVDDLPGIAELRAAVGWGVHDWALRAAVQAPGARCLVAVDGTGRIVAVGSGISYGRLGFVGNMVVDAAHRRRGLGSAILAEVTSFLDAAGCRRIELYATTDGRPLYARHGFEVAGTSALARVTRDLPLEREASITMRRGGSEDLDRLAAYDRPRFGGDRRPLLAIMLEDAAQPLLLAERDDEMVGYAWVRPEVGRIGPVLADAPAVASTLLVEAFDRMPSVEELRLNLPLGDGPGAGWLRARRVELEPWDGRMARGPQVPRREETVYGSAVGALG